MTPAPGTALEYKREPKRQIGTVGDKQSDYVLEIDYDHMPTPKPTTPRSKQNANISVAALPAAVL